MRVRFGSRVKGTDCGDYVDFAVKWNGDVVHGLVRLQEPFIFNVGHAVVTFASH